MYRNDINSKEINEIIRSSHLEVRSINIKILLKWSLLVFFPPDTVHLLYTKVSFRIKQILLKSQDLRKEVLRLGLTLIRISIVPINVYKQQRKFSTRTRKVSLARVWYYSAVLNGCLRVTTCCGKGPHEIRVWTTAKRLVCSVEWSEPHQTHFHRGSGQRTSTSLPPEAEPYTPAAKVPGNIVWNKWYTPHKLNIPLFVSISDIFLQNCMQLPDFTGIVPVSRPVWSHG